MLRLVRQIMKFCGPYARRIRIAWVFSFLRAFCANAPFMVGIVLVNMLVEGTLTPLGCVVAACVMVLLLVLQSLFQHAADRLQSTAGYELFAEKRLEFANHLRRLPMGYFTEGNMGRISSVLSVDMVFIEEHAMTVLADIAANIFAQFIITVFMFLLHPLLGAAVLACELIAIAVAQPMHKEAFGNATTRQQTLEELTSSLLEYLEGLRIIKSFNRTGEGAQDLREAFRKTTEANLGFEEEHAPWMRRLLIVYAIGMTAVVALAIWLLQGQVIEVGSFIGVMLFAFNLFAPLQALYQLESQITIMQAALNRLESVMAESEIKDVGALHTERESAAGSAAPSGQASFVAGAPEIEFDEVRFGYGEEEVLHGVSFTAEAGQTIALVGQSGSGKSTIANLLARFWDIDGGGIRLRGVDVRELPLEALMENLSMVFQHVYLFEDTVYNNISMGRPEATEEEVHEAARKARCFDFITSMPYGFNTRIGEGGATLSGGEAQRISIARAILKDAPIIILDEATASIDADNESAIQAAMTELCRDKTTLVIAHRLNTIVSADKIVVLEDGHVVEQGTAQDLLAARGAFASMVKSAQQTNEWAGQPNDDSAAGYSMSHSHHESGRAVESGDGQSASGSRGGSGKALDSRPSGGTEEGGA